MISRPTIPSLPKLVSGRGRTGILPYSPEFSCQRNSYFHVGVRLARNVQINPASCSCPELPALAPTGEGKVTGHAQAPIRKRSLSSLDERSADAGPTGRAV
jgi:hypothetical protein